MDQIEADAVETDTRFPTGPWTGFFLQCWLPGRHRMVLDLHFDAGRLQASGTDDVGPFTFDGEYDPADGKCSWIKQYTGRHSIRYRGANEGHGIWGVWELPQLGGLFMDRGVFHIWPEGMAPTEEAEATVKAYRDYLRSSDKLRLAAVAVGVGLIGFVLALASGFMRSLFDVGIP
jgi:hypothetical protein